MHKDLGERNYTLRGDDSECDERHSGPDEEEEKKCNSERVKSGLVVSFVLGLG
jgi:hypothetical protein